MNVPTTHLSRHTLTTYVWNKEELPQHWKESISVHIYKKGDEARYNNNYQEMFAVNCIQHVI
jgi:hypothetical protein